MLLLLLRFSPSRWNLSGTFAVLKSKGRRIVVLLNCYPRNRRIPRFSRTTSSLMYCSSLYKCVKAGFALSLYKYKADGTGCVVRLRRVVTQLCLQIPLQSITAFSLPPSSHSLSLSTASVANLLHWSTIGKTDRRMVVRCNKMGYPIRIVSPSPCGLQDVESSVCVEMRDANCNKIQRAGVVERKRQVPDTQL